MPHACHLRPAPAVLLLACAAVSTAAEVTKPCAPTLPCSTAYPGEQVGEAKYKDLLGDTVTISIRSNGNGYNQIYPLWDAARARRKPAPGEVTGTLYWKTCNCYAVWSTDPLTHKMTQRLPEDGDTISPAAPAAGDGCDIGGA